MRKMLSKYWPQSTVGKIATIILLTWIAIAIFGPILANNKPIIAKSNAGWTFPIWSQNEAHELASYDFQINPLIPYRFDDIDTDHDYAPPFSEGISGIHILGTDQLGRDTLAGLINGARVAFLVGFLVIIISASLGIFIGMSIGFYGDKGIRKNIPQQLLIIILFTTSLYYLIHVAKDGIAWSNVLPLILLSTIAYLGDLTLNRLAFKKYGLPIDIFVQRLFEINESVPGLFIILAFIAILTKSTLFSLAIIISFLMWMTFARHARSETLQIREEQYISSAKASGMSDIRILIYHVLPNALPTLLVVSAFAFSGVILLESTLSFLGIGLPIEEVSWGKILAEARKNPTAWWLAVFPGLAIFLVLYSFNILGDILANYQRNRS